MSTPHRLETPSSPPSSTFRLADRGIVSGGNQYDALPSGEPSLRTAVTDVSMSGGDAYTRSTSAQGQKRAPAVNPGGPVAAGTPVTKDLSNAKLALNQSVSPDWYCVCSETIWLTLMYNFYISRSY
jgi:hypothetical protein